MQKLAEICIRRPVFASMLILSLMVVGAAGYYNLGVDRFPSVDLPTISVRTSLPGASPEEMETLISQPIEEVVNTVDGIEQLRSVSGQGTSFIIATFRLNRDIESAAQDVRDRIATVVRRLPRDVQAPVVSKFDNDSNPILSIAISSDRSIRELTEIADKTVKVRLERAQGVGEVQIVGGLDRAINIWIDSQRLAAYKIPITQVRQALQRQNADAPGGAVDAGRRELTLRTLGRIVDPRDFEELTVATINGTPIRIRDIGHAEDGTKEQRSVSRLNGVPTVQIDIRRQSGANTVAVIENAKKELAAIKNQLPGDVKLEIIRDQSTYIESALHEIKVHLILGSLLACLVVLFFMKSWRSTIIAGIAIPTSVVATFGMMWALDFTLNGVTMLALVLMVGVVIDDAIVVLENIFRFIEEKGMSPMQAAKEATADIGLAVLATTLSLVVIFLPVSFMSSISGRFLYQFGITAAVSILVSLLVSFTLTPMMSARLLKKESGVESLESGVKSEEDSKAGTAELVSESTTGSSIRTHNTSDLTHDSRLQTPDFSVQTPDSRGGFYGIIDGVYTWMLRGAMRWRSAVVVVSLAVILSSGWFYGKVRQEYTPTNVDEAEFEMNINAPEGTSLAAMNDAVQAIEKEVRSVPGVRLVLASAGSGFLGGVNQGNMYVRIAPHDERTVCLTKFWNELRAGRPLGVFKNNYAQRDVMQEIRKRMRKYAPLRVSVRNATSFNLGGGNFEIDFVLRGPELMALSRYAEELRERALKMGGIADPDTTLKLDKPELRVRIDRDRAADLGVDATDVAESLRLMVGGDQEVSRFRDETTGEDYDVQLRLTNGERNDPGTISRLYVPSSRGGVIPIQNLVALKEETSPSRIDRIDRQRAVSLRASTAPGYALADRLEALRTAYKEMNVPAGYSTAVNGRGRELERTFTEFIFAFLLSIAFMYMILASQFESTIHPVTILLSLPLSIPFALFSLWITDDTLNLYSALGILVLFGVVKKNSILQIDHISNLRRAGMNRYDAIIQGNRDRLRPILMTTLALVAGMLPLALGAGPGSEERRSIAVLVIGGQSLSLLLTLIATPVAYSLFDDVTDSSAWKTLAGRLGGKSSKRRPAEVVLPPPDDAVTEK